MTKKGKLATFKKQVAKFWKFIWYDDSLLSWVVNIVLAFLIIKFIFFPGLSLIFQTSLPVVAVVSGSMEHKAVNPCETYVLGGICVEYDKSRYEICGDYYTERPKANFSLFWKSCGDWYEQRNISQDLFKTFSFKNGFNVGDVMVIRGKDFNSVEVGEIIVFISQDGIPIIHRVVERKQIGEQLYLQTKGDHNADSISGGPRSELTVSQDQYVGTAIVKIPWLGHVKLFFVKVVAKLSGV